MVYTVTLNPSLDYVMYPGAYLKRAEQTDPTEKNFVRAERVSMSRLFLRILMFPQEHSDL